MVGRKGRSGSIYLGAKDAIACAAGKVDKEAMIDGLEGLQIKSPTGRMTIGKNHHAAMTLFLAKTKGRDLVTVCAL